MGTRETGAHYVEESQHSCVVAHHKQVLLRLQPRQARCTVLDITARRVLESVADLAITGALSLAFRDF